MESRKLVYASVLFFAISSGSVPVSASNAIKAEGGLFDTMYPGNSVTCFVCHDGTPGAFTPYGYQYVSNGGTNAEGSYMALKLIEGLDADGDGSMNIEEIQLGHDPNDADSFPIIGDDIPIAEDDNSGFSGYDVGCMAITFTAPWAIVVVTWLLGYFIRKLHQPF